MKKYYVFGDSKLLICDIFLSILASFVLLLFMTFGLNVPIYEFLIIFIFSSLFILMFYVLHHPYEISLVCLDKDGISSGRTKLLWEDIKEYKLFDIDPYKFNILFGLKPKSNVLCIGQSDSKTLTWYWPKQCILISITQKNLKKIKEMNCNKSPAINELLSLYLREGDH